VLKSVTSEQKIFKRALFRAITKTKFFVRFDSFVIVLLMEIRNGNNIHVVDFNRFMAFPKQYLDPPDHITSSVFWQGKRERE